MPYTKKRLAVRRRRHGSAGRALSDWMDFVTNAPVVDANGTVTNAAPVATTTPAASTSFLDKLGGAISGAFAQKPSMVTAFPGAVMPVSPGMSPTTMVVLAGGAVLAVVLLTRR